MGGWGLHPSGGDQPHLPPLGRSPVCISQCRLSSDHELLGHGGFRSCLFGETSVCVGGGGLPDCETVSVYILSPLLVFQI